MVFLYGSQYELEQLSRSVCLGLREEYKIGIFYALSYINNNLIEIWLMTWLKDWFWYGNMPFNGFFQLSLCSVIISGRDSYIDDIPRTPF